MGKLKKAKTQNNLKLTEGIIVADFCKKMLKNKSNNKYFPNVKFLNYETDILEITKSGYSYEYEVKLTKADFKSDGKKFHTKLKISEGKYIRESIKKYDQISSGKRVNHFYYVVPENLIGVDDVPDFAGLIYVYKREEFNHIFYKTVKTAPKLSKDKFPDILLQKCLLSTYYRFHNYYQNKHKIK